MLICLGGGGVAGRREEGRKEHRRVKTPADSVDGAVVWGGLGLIGVAVFSPPGVDGGAGLGALGRM